MTNKFAGVWTAIITPFLKSGAIDWDSFDALMKLQIEAGITGVVLSGTTGESPTLTVQENLSLIRRAKANHGSDILIMGGIGGNNTAQTVELAKLASESGADCLLGVTPPYNKPSLEGLIAHYGAIIKAQPKPICVYHVPGRTGQKLTANELATISSLDGIIMIKEASADLGLFSRSMMNSKNALYLSGDDPTYLASLAIGGQGVISVLTNVFPKAYVDLNTAYINKNYELAQKYHEAVLDFVDILFCEPNPCPAKAILSHLGLCLNELRLPLVSVKEDNYKKIISLYETTKTKLESIKT